MPFGDFRSVFMPYCLRKQADGRYAVLNREYKPVGFFTRQFIDYSQHPVTVRLKGLTPLKASKLSHDGSDSVDDIFLYNDASVPTQGQAEMASYLEKLALLAKLRIDEEAPSAS